MFKNFLQTRVTEMLKGVEWGRLSLISATVVGTIIFFVIVYSIVTNINSINRSMDEISATTRAKIIANESHEAKLMRELSLQIDTLNKKIDTMAGEINRLSTATIKGQATCPSSPVIEKAPEPTVWERISE